MTLQKLAAEDDCELVVELCMLAGTHTVNATLHDRGFDDDIVHSDFLGLDPSDSDHVLRPDWARLAPGPDVTTALQDLARVEAFRRTHVRGPMVDSAAAAESMALLRRIRERLARA